MKRTLTILSVMAILLASTSAFATSGNYGWSLSDSVTDGCSNTGEFMGAGILNLYLWHNYRVSNDQIASADMSLVSNNPGNIILAFTVANGFLNAGGATDLLLAIGGCPEPPIMAGVALVSSNVPGGYCIAGLNVTVDCGPNEIHVNSVTGYDNSGNAACVVDGPGNNSNGCEAGVVSVEDSSWGSIKGLYR